MMAACDDASDDCINLTRVYTLNYTAACLWQLFGEQEVEIELLSRLMYERFDESLDKISNDVVIQLSDWETMGLIESNACNEIGL